MIESRREQLGARGRIRALPHPLTPYTELIVNFCPTGMIPTKGMTPHVPVTPAEVIDHACLALERGVAIVLARNAAAETTRR
ncbi:MAG: 3-keto-5-aminohexanoate cleavage protein [Gemmatimonadales bacterium]